MTFRTALIISAALLFPATAHAMCGGGMKMGAEKSQAASKSMCMGDMGSMDMAAKTETDKAKPADPNDPHAGMDMGDGKSAGMKMDGMKMGCCSCCGGMGGDGKKSGGMCGQKASMTSEDGKNDPLLTDPMWNKTNKKPQSFAPANP